MFNVQISSVQMFSQLSLYNIGVCVRFEQGRYDFCVNPRTSKRVFTVSLCQFFSHATYSLPKFIIVSLRLVAKREK
jgi:hypothetical protein